MQLYPFIHSFSLFPLFDRIVQTGGQEYMYIYTKYSRDWANNLLLIIFGRDQQNLVLSIVRSCAARAGVKKACAACLAAREACAARLRVRKTCAAHLGSRRACAAHLRVRKACAACLGSRGACAAHLGSRKASAAYHGPRNACTARLGARKACAACLAK